MTATTWPTMSCRKLQDPLSRVNGVGDTQVFGSQYAMRIWVDPLKLNNFALTMADVTRRGDRAERAGLGRPDRRAAGAQGADAQRDRLGRSRG